jgi:hypothetical protein
MYLSKNKNGVVITVVLFSFLLIAPLADGQDDAAKQQAEKAEAEKIKQNLVVTGIEPYVDKNKGIPGDPNQLGSAGMGDSISVIIPGLWYAAEHKVVDPSKLVLFVDGRVFKDVYPKSKGTDNLVYKLERTSGAMDAWNGVLGSPRLEEIKPVVISVGYPDQEPLRLGDKFRNADGSNNPNFNLIVYRKGWAWVALLVLIASLIIFYKYGRKNLLRDSGPPNPLDGKSRPYSLAKVQMAWWFFIVIGSFLLIYVITGEFTITEQALILMGIGTGTALGAAMIDSSKQTSADTELETLVPQRAKAKAALDLLDQQITAAEQSAATDADKAALQAQKVDRAEKAANLDVLDAKIANAESGLHRPTSEGPWNDLVTDANGPSFHRFQMIVWTFILGLLFLAGVYRNLAMPEFSGTLLALMGISAGTYLGFKVPEQQSKGEQTIAEGAGATTATTTSQPVETAATNGTAQAGASTNGSGTVADTTTAMDAAADQLDGHDVAMTADTPDEELPITEGGVK